MGYGRSFERLLRLGRRDLWESVWGLLLAWGRDYSILLPAGHIFWAPTWAGFGLVQKQGAGRRNSWLPSGSALSNCTSLSVSLWLDALPEGPTEVQLPPDDWMLGSRDSTLSLCPFRHGWQQLPVVVNHRILQELRLALQLLHCCVTYSLN